MNGVTLGQVTDWIITLGAIAGALVAVWAMLHLMVVRPMKEWLRRQVRAPLIRLERRLDDHIKDHPGASGKHLGGGT